MLCCAMPCPPAVAHGPMQPGQRQCQSQCQSQLPGQILGVEESAAAFCQPSTNHPPQAWSDDHQSLTAHTRDRGWKRGLNPSCAKNLLPARYRYRRAAHVSPGLVHHPKFTVPGHYSFWPLDTLAPGSRNHWDCPASTGTGLQKQSSICNLSTATVKPASTLNGPNTCICK
jgi:hypothetical protein